MIKEAEWIKHLDPIWRHKSNYIGNMELGAEQLPHKYEQLWLRKMPSNTYEVCCIPYFIYGLNLGDVVELSATGFVSKVVTKSGHETFRVFFSPDQAKRDTILRRLQEMNVTYEMWSQRLFSVDSPDAKKTSDLLEYFNQLEANGDAQYETGWS